ncbi:MAG: DEAD/DEAH box helicase family protein, partial [Candidatus Nanohaloarchaea archaeon]|nr:DEAD/DEAH box helicase family protein [Candidatus Nanohaloarchaea archaeon]
QALKKRNNLIAHAPTGLGKTAATVPSSLAYALEKDKRVFFVTPRHSQHEIAVETLKEIREEHQKSFVAVDLIGKQWLCEGEQGANVYLEGEESDCPRHDNTYTDQHQLTERAQQKKAEIKREILRAEEVKERCDKVCPYDILMHTAADADIVIGDYFHIFHPGVREALFSKGSINLQDSIIIVDEAHNLADRTRSLNSAHLNEKMLKNAATEAAKYGYYDDEERAKQLRQELQRLARNELGMERETQIGQDDFTQRVTNIRDYDSLIADFEAVAKEAQEDGEDSDCGEIANFLDRWRGTDHGFTRILKKVQRSSGETYISLSYRCLDPQYTTKEVIRQSHTTIAMSGTLTPLHMYQDILGFPDNRTYTEKYGSPFPEENKLNLLVDQVTTKYKERDEEQYRKIAWYIKKSSEHVRGNIGVFFPSYSLMHEVKDQIEDRM